MRLVWIINSLVLVVVLVSTPAHVFGQRGRGGGGGGGFRGGGGGGMSHSSLGGASSRPMSAPSSMGGAQRPSNFSTANRSPSMSRTNPASAGTRMPATTGARMPSAANRGATPPRPAAARGAGAGSLAGGANAQARSAAAGQQAFQRPTSDQLSNFLGTSPSSTRTSSRSSGEGRASASTRSTEGDGSGFNSKTFTTEGGATITVGGGKGSGVTEGGTTVGGAVGGIKIETAGGDTIVRGKGAVGAANGDDKAFAAGSRTGVQTSEGASAVAGRGVRGATDGENSAVRGGAFAAGQDGQGNSAMAARGGYADSSGYRQGGAMTATRDSEGYTRVNAAAGYNDNGTGQIKTGSAVVGPNGNVVATGQGAAFVNGQFVGGSTWTAVNGNYTHWGYFGPGYVTTYPNCWWPGKWAVATTAWATAAYAVAGPYCGCSETSTYYDYGENVTYSEGNVYYGDEAVATEEQYYQEAQDLAAAGDETENENEDWLPLGVFAVVSEASQSKTDKVVQLALNRDGMIRGNFHDVVTDQVTKVSGSVNKETQRVALRLDGNDKLLVETGLYNLTNDEVPILVHFGPDKREERSLIRLQQPEETTESPADESPAK